MNELKFIILKINDRDVGQLSEKDAVQMFLSDGPIVVQMQRKPHASAEEPPSPSSPRKAVELTDSELTGKFANLCVVTRPEGLAVVVNGGLAAKVPGTAVGTQTDECFPLQDESVVNCNGAIKQGETIFDQCLAPELDIEEITLRKSDSNERLGLTVCYSGGSNAGSGNAYGALSGSEENELCAEVFISDIQPDSIAYRDGRLRQGDQILQINGKDLKSKEETELLIAENNNAVTLLVSRYVYAMGFNDPFVTDLDLEDEDEDDYYDENNEYENCFISNDNCINVVDGEQLAAAEPQPQRQPPSKTEPDTATTVATASEPSEMSAAPVEVAEEKATFGLEKAKPDSAAICKTEPRRKAKSMDNKKKNLLPNMPSDYDTEHIYETIPEDSESEPLYCSPYESSTYVMAVGSCSSVGADFKALPANGTAERRVPPSKTFNTVGPYNAISLRAMDRNVTSASTDDPDNSSSAYNTGGSNNSVSALTLAHKEKGGTCNSKANNAVSYSANDAHLNDSQQQQQQQQLSQKTMYTNEANLQQTMLLQQHILRQAVYNQGPNATEILTVNQCPQFTAPNLSQYHFVSSQEVCASNACYKPSGLMLSQNNPSDEAMVWKVKRRPDGTRYIVRRPVRNRLVRERSLRVNAAVRCRNENTTTEEDTISEVKTGRYWSKEERKKHIEKARERRQQHQQTMASHTNSGMPTMRISDRNSFKVAPPSGNLMENHLTLSARQPSVRLNKHNSAKSAQQYYQLQFNSCNGQPSKVAAFVNNIDNLKQDTVVLPPYLPSSSLTTSNVHTRSPINTAVRATAGIDVGEGGTVPPANYTTTAEPSGGNNFLSVTTV